MTKQGNTSFKVFWSQKFITIFGENLNTDFHKHHAIQFSASLGGKISVDCEGHTHFGDIVLIDSMKRHSIKMSGINVMILLDPDYSGAKLMKDILADGNCKTIDLVESDSIRMLLQNVWDDFENKSLQYDLIDSIFRAFDPNASKLSANLDERIRKALVFIDGLDQVSITPNELAKQVHLSESRFQHLFREEVGIPLTKYLLWRRMLRSIQSILDGNSYTDAAISAGFSDSSHFSRTVRSHFGLSLSSAMHDSRFIQVITDKLW